MTSAGRPTVDLDLLGDLWYEIARDAELPLLDDGALKLAAAEAAGTGDALRRLTVEALARRRRREPRAAADGAGNLGVAFDALGRLPPWLPARTAERLRRRALARVAIAARRHLGLPWPAVAALVGVPPRTLRRWAGQLRRESGQDCADWATDLLGSAQQPHHRKEQRCRH